jgi:hypothetical protein
MTLKSKICSYIYINKWILQLWLKIQTVKTKKCAYLIIEGDISPGVDNVKWHIVAGTNAEWIFNQNVHSLTHFALFSGLRRHSGLWGESDGIYCRNGNLIMSFDITKEFCKIPTGSMNSFSCWHHQLLIRGTGFPDKCHYFQSHC